MINVNIETAQTVSLKKAEANVAVDLAKMPEASLVHIFNYGLRQIRNDAMASAKDKAEAVAFAEKRLANLMSGTLRASPQREGDPVRARAIELAVARIVVNPAYVAWLAKSSLKRSDKDAVAKARELAKDAIAKEGNAFMIQAAIDVEAAKGLDIEIEL